MEKAMKVHHVGYLVKNMDKSSEVFEKLGYKKQQVTYDPIQKAQILFLDMDGLLVELVAPSAESDIYPLLKKYRNTPYHICYQVVDMESMISELLNIGFMLFREPVPAIAISDRAKVSFLMSQNAGMIELVEL